MATKTEAAHDVRKVLQSVKDYIGEPGRPKLSEADTRAHFIDPLLRALGYHSIGDIQHEVYVDSAKQYLDYLLVVDALPRAAVEAKAIDVTFTEPQGAQVVQYCSVLGIEWAVVTNAREWRLYHGFAKGPLAEKLVAAVNLTSWDTDGQFNALFEQLWLVSKEAFQSSGGPSSWLAAQQLDAILQKSLTEPTSPEIRYMRRRLLDQGITATTDQLVTWFKLRFDSTSAGRASTPFEPVVEASQPIVAKLAARKPASGDPPSPRYYRVMLGHGSAHADVCRAGGFIGTDFGIAQDLSNGLPDDWRLFNAKFIPTYLAANPTKTKVAAGLACGALWTVSKGLELGDVVLCPNGKGQYMVGRVSGPYYYRQGEVLPHRRPVGWLPSVVSRSSMSEALRNSTGSIGTVSNVTSHAAEISQLLDEALPSGA